MKHSVECERFAALVDRVPAVPRSVIKQRVEEHRKQAAMNPVVRTEIETENRQAAFRLGPRLRREGLIDCRFFRHPAGDFGPRQTLPYDLADGQIKAVTVIHVLAVVVSERLLIYVLLGWQRRTPVAPSNSMHRKEPRSASWESAVLRR